MLKQHEKAKKTPSRFLRMLSSLFFGYYVILLIAILCIALLFTIMVLI